MLKLRYILNQHPSFIPVCTVIESWMEEGRRKVLVMVSRGERPLMC